MSRRILSSAVLGFGCAIGLAIAAQAQEVPSEEKIAEANIIFPVVELGGCEDKRACKAYCDDPAHLVECVDFAEKHGLMKREEAARARKFGGRVVQGVGGPGGCRSHQECERYCQDVTHLDECLAFAEEEGIDDPHIGEARRIREHLRGGGRMPGGCTSKEACEAYCESDFSHMEECFAFAQAAGLEVGDEEEEDGPKSPEQIRQFIELAKKGETPGGCKNRQECDAFCSSPDNVLQCVEFGAKLGFIQPKEAEMIRKTGGKGPGGCRGREECEAFCNNPENQEACFAFAEEHGLIPEEELRHAKEGLVRMRQGLQHAPEEVRECLKSNFGEGVLDKIQSGTFTPGRDSGDKIRQCFESFGGGPDPREIFEEVPEGVLACAREKIGGERFEALKLGSAQFGFEEGDVFRGCGEEIGRQEIENMFRGMPPEVKACVEARVGDRLRRPGGHGGLGPDPGIEQGIRSCFEEFGGFGPGGRGRFGPPGDFGGGEEDDFYGEDEDFEESDDEFPALREGARDLFHPEAGPVPPAFDDFLKPENVERFKSLREGAGSGGLGEEFQKQFGEERRRIEEGARGSIEDETRRRIEDETRARLEGGFGGQMPPGGFGGTGGFLPPDGFRPPEGGAGSFPPPSDLERPPEPPKQGLLLRIVKGLFGR